MQGATERPDGIDLVIFDCDGVLVDSERLTVRIESRLLGELGWPLTEAEVVERFVGRSNRYMLSEIERELGRPVPEWTPMYRAEQRRSFDEELTAVEGALEALAQVEAWDLRTCVASSGTHEKMEHTLAITGLWDRFEGRIYSATQVAEGKPAPDLFLFAAQQMGASPAGCVVVEDSPFGIAAAVAAGMRSVAYATPLIAADKLTDATAVITDLAALPQALAGLPPAGGAG